MHSAERSLLFDFDGVVVSSFDLCLSLNKKIFHSADLTPEKYRQEFEKNIFESLKDTDVATSERLLASYMDAYTSGIQKYHPVPGMKELIIKAAEQFRLAIVSATYNRSIQSFLEQHGLNEYFSEILGGDVGHSKSKKIEQFCADWQTTPQKCLFITDTLGDLHEAAAVATPSIGVTWGFHTSETLRKGSPMAIVTSPTELSDRIYEHFSI